MRLSLLRAPTQPDPETDMGSHAFSWAVYPHLGTFAESDVPQVAYAFNTPLHRASDVIPSSSLDSLAPFPPVSMFSAPCVSVFRLHVPSADLFSAYRSSQTAVPFHSDPAPSRSARIFRLALTRRSSIHQLQDERAHHLAPRAVATLQGTGDAQRLCRDDQAGRGRRGYGQDHGCASRFRAVWRSCQDDAEDVRFTPFHRLDMSLMLHRQLRPRRDQSESRQPARRRD
jgi:hypothetical protein